MLRRRCRSLAKRPPGAGPQHNPPRNVIGPFAGRAFSERRALQAHEHGSPWRVANGANNPIPACTPPIREITAAHCFGVLGEPTHDIRGLRGHEPTSDDEGPPFPAGPGGALVTRPR